MNLDKKAERRKADSPSPSQIKRAAIVNLVFHGAIALVLVWFLAYHCPVVIERLKNGGHFPPEFRAFMYFYNFVSPCFILPIGLALIWLDARVFSLLHRQHRGLASLFWFWGVPLALAFFMAFSVWALNSAW